MVGRRHGTRGYRPYVYIRREQPQRFLYVVQGNSQAFYLALGVFDLPGKFCTLGDQRRDDVRKRLTVCVVKGNQFVAHGTEDGGRRAARLWGKFLCLLPNTGNFPRFASSSALAQGTFAPRSPDVWPLVVIDLQRSG